MVTSAIVAREKQLAELAAVVGLHIETSSDPSHHGLPPLEEPAPPLVVVYGGVSTGKSLCVGHALRGAADHYAHVDCTGVMATRMFYREVLGQLQNNARGPRRPRRDARAASDGVESVVESEVDGDQEEETDTDEVTITDAPPAALVESDVSTAKSLRSGRAGARRRRRRGADAHKCSDESGSQGEEEDIGEDDVPSRARNAISAVAKGGGVGEADAAHGSLNFLSFVKALRGHMDGAPMVGDVNGPKPTVFIALDHVETLLARGFEKLLTCLLAVNDQLDYLHIFDANGAPWRLCVILIARAVSLNLDLFLHGAHPAFIHFPPYTKEQVAAIVTQNLLCAADLSVALDDNRERAAWLRKWLVHLYELLPHCHNDWLEFQHVVVQMLPSFHEFFDLVSIDDHAQLPQLVGAAPGSERAENGDGTNHSWIQLQKASTDRIRALEGSRRRHLFGYDNVSSAAAMSVKAASSLSTDSTAKPASVSSGDPVAFIASSKLSRSCLLLLIASYLASFTPHEADNHFVSSSGGLKRKRRVQRESGGANGTPGDANGIGTAKKGSSSAATRKAMNQQLIGPKIFELPRLLAIYLSLQVESDAQVDEAAAAHEISATSADVNAAGFVRRLGERSTRTRADIFTHLSLLVRLRLLQRASPPSDLDQPLFRCIADTRLVQEIARRLRFPLDSYLNTRG